MKMKAFFYCLAVGRKLCFCVGMIPVLVLLSIAIIVAGILDRKKGG